MRGPTSAETIQTLLSCLRSLLPEMQWPVSAPLPRGISIAALVARFRRHALRYYAGSQEAENFQPVIQAVRTKFGKLPAAEFTPLKAKALRDYLIDKGWSRKYINRQMGRLRAIFCWAVSEELIPPSTYQGLLCVRGIRRGRLEVRETEPVRPVPDSLLKPTLAKLHEPIRSMVELQWLTGARQGEICSMRGRDLDTSRRTWVYRPNSHKTAHHGHERALALGPRARAIVRHFLRADLDAYLFSPAEAEARRRTAMSAKRKTPLSCGNRPGTNRKQSPKTRLGQKYSSKSYYRAVYRAIKKAFPIPPDLTDPDDRRRWIREHHWHPHQLRHKAATDIRRQFGLEASTAVLGHRTPAQTAIYAEIDLSKARRAMERVG